MQRDFKNIELLERYTNGEMSLDEAASFEEKLNLDKELAEDLRKYKDLLIGIELFSNQELEKKVNQVHEKLEKESFFEKDDEAKVFKFKPRYLISIAASILLIIGFFYLRTNNEEGADKIFAQYYEPEKNVIKAILDDLDAAGFGTVDDAKKEELANALGAYEKLEFNLAQEKLEAFLKKYSSDNLATLYLGLAYIHLENYDKGLNLLIPLANNSSNNNKDLVKWYAALGLLKRNNDSDKSEALEFFKELCQGNSNFKEKACVIPSKL